MTHEHDPFVGHWELDPTKSQYAHGAPPKSGMYEIRRNQSRYQFIIRWKTEDGAPGEARYDGIPDDQRHPHANTGVADAISMTRVHERRLDTKAFKAEQVVNHATRELSEDGQCMTVCQRGKTPQGQEYCNIAVYRRVSD